MSAYYNEIDKFAAAWLRELIRAGLIADGEVDERDIRDVQPADLWGFTQCHFFAGIGGWSHALRLAGWPDGRSVWTGSPPCQRHSSATRGRPTADDLWPELFRLIEASRPDILFGEQVAKRVWVDVVVGDLETVDYELWGAVLPACSVGHDHVRERFYFACYPNGDSESRRPVHAEASRVPRARGDAGAVVPTNGVSRDVVALSGFGNAIVPQVAAEFIGAYLAVVGSHGTQVLSEASGSTRSEAQ